MEGRRLNRSKITGEVLGVPFARNVGSLRSGFFQDGTKVKRKKPGSVPNAECTSSFCGHKQYVSIRAADRRCQTLCERCGAPLDINWDKAPGRGK